MELEIERSVEEATAAAAAVPLPMSSTPPLEREREREDGGTPPASSRRRLTELEKALQSNGLQMMNLNLDQQARDRRFFLEFLTYQRGMLVFTPCSP